MYPFSIAVALNNYTGDAAEQMDSNPGTGVGILTELKIGSTEAKKFAAFDFKGGKGTAMDVAGVLNACEIKAGISPIKLWVYMSAKSAGPLDTLIKSQDQIDKLPVEFTIQTYVRNSDFAEKDRKIVPQIDKKSVTGLLVTSPKPTEIGPLPVSPGNTLFGYQIEVAPVPGGGPTTFMIDSLGTNGAKSVIWGIK